MNDIGKILPIEGYRVSLRGSLSSDYTVALTHLYQPLIGIQATSLYMTLLNDLGLQEDLTQTHHTLMNYMDLPLDTIYRARLKLEGLGLLKTFKQESNEQAVYLYELWPPFSPREFFTDDMLIQLLYHHIGEDKFNKLKGLFQVASEEKGIDITSQFNEVFNTYQFHTTDVEIPNRQHMSGETDLSIDFSWLEQMLQARMLPVDQILTPYNKRLIYQMMTLYELADFEIEKAILWALTEDNGLDSEEFKGACHDLFQNKHEQTATVKLTEKLSQSQKDSETSVKPATKEEQLIQKLETISPKQLLEDMSNGGEASGQDLKVIREVMATQGLPAPVMNVLIHYVLLQSDMKLSKAYMETIASHWSRANLQTAKEAMKFAKRQKSQYQNQKTKQQKQNKSASKEVVPEWFKERKKQQNNTQTEPSVTSEEEWQETENLLRKYSKR